MSNPFTDLGVPLRFDLDDATLADAGQRATASGSSSAMQSFETLANPRLRAEALLAALAGPTAAEEHSLPPGFPQLLAALETQVAQNAAAARESVIKAQDERWTSLAHLFKQLAGFDKGPVQMGRRRMVRRELNALDALEPLIMAVSK